MGTSDGSSTHHGMYWDHPHACGDKYDFFNDMINQAGSSPRVWGQVVICLYIPPFNRIIPTRVGTSLPVKALAVCNKDHPHACGDKVQSLSLRRILRGSSPRVWGQVIYNNYLRTPNRIIPTRVGTRLKRIFTVQRIEDHPHACGDKTVQRIDYPMKIGSSPRVWGQEVYLIIESRGIRIIPTRVGTREVPLL